MANTKQTPIWVYPLIVFLATFSLFTLFNDSNRNSNTSENQNSSVKGEQANLDFNEANLTTEKYLVTRVKDGDTIVLDEIGTIRLIGIDTAELTGNECFSKEAKEFLEQRLLGKEVEIVYDESQGQKDKYDRTLGYILLENENINLELVRKGYAEEYTYNKSYIFQEEFLSAQELAKQEQLGLWESCKCVENKEVSRSCISCKLSAVTRTHDDCTKFEVKVTDTSCTNGCYVAPPAPKPTQPAQNTSPTYVCNCSKTCSQLSCAEAQYQLNICGCSRRDGDNDGIACDASCQ